MLKRIAAMLCIASVLFIVGCAAHVHNIGDGIFYGDLCLSTKLTQTILQEMQPITKS